MVKLTMLTGIVLGITADCQNVVNFAIGLGLDVSQPTEMSKLRLNCCTAPSMDCIGQAVTGINWGSMGLTGSMNGTAIPKSTRLLMLDFNSIVGKIPDFSTTGIQNLWLDHNFLSGELPEAYPVGFYEIHADDNYLTGDVPLFPSTLVTCYLGWSAGGNKLTGTLIIGTPLNVGITSNWIADIIIGDTSQIIRCDLSRNPLLGNPRLTSLTMCSKSGLYSPLRTLSTSLSKTTKLSTTIRSMLYSTAFRNSFYSSLISAISTSSSAPSTKTTGKSSSKTNTSTTLTKINTPFIYSDINNPPTFIQSEILPLDKIDLESSEIFQTATTKITKFKTSRKTTSETFKAGLLNMNINDGHLSQMIIRESLSVMILLYVLFEAPLKRELRSKNLKSKKKNDDFM